ncbi:hypothetical protein [Mesorhizobium australafricanum]|uniref:Uncharacterized protein n=1 Tax=Mesorhizobium australafricanum TaxID=3072311 RepID=A0ABU4WW23_9HYPH|nr:hypothetical protein [Mesorhizobium sp. VK3E]MDX8440264.1 hypothetical protein [Mesorhizobium sp. VK3E]
MTAFDQIIVCDIAPGGVYVLLVCALVLVSRSARRASADRLDAAFFIDIHDTAGLPFLIVVPSSSTSLAAKPPMVRALGSKARMSTTPASQLGGTA